MLGGRFAISTLATLNMPPDPPVTGGFTLAGLIPPVTELKVVFHTKPFSTL
jgi:hypothetical protein